MRIVVTVVGKDRVGIIYRVTGILAKNHVNVLNINQNITDGFFNMILLADMAGARTEIGALRDHLEALAKELGVEIRVQSEQIFTAMHRI